MRTIFFFLFSAFCLSSSGQTWEEWWEQKETQIKYLKEQIVALQAYSKVVNKGYDIAKDGLDIIGQIKKGDFDLHSEKFLLLMLVNPLIANSERVKEAFNLTSDINAAISAILKKLKEGDELTSNEINYIKKVLIRLKERAANSLQEIIKLSSSYSYELSDDERVKRINGHQIELEDQLSFTWSFQSQIQLLVLQRIKERKSVSSTRNQYGLK